MKSITLKATVVLPHLVLQQPSRSLRSRNSAYIKRRLALGSEGRLMDLLCEGKAILAHLPKIKSKKHPNASSMYFAEKMYQGKVKVELECLKWKEKGGF